MYYLGIDIGGTAVKCGLFTKEGELLKKHEFSTSTVLKKIVEDLEKTFELWGIPKTDITAAGIGVPGPVAEDGKVVHCPNIGWKDYYIEKEFFELSGIKAGVLNDANAAALGEYWRGGGKSFKSIVMVTLGTGVGGGIITESGVFMGSSGYSGEIGHMTVNPMETECCGCGGKGHLEQYASATGLVNMTLKELQKSEERSVLRDVERLTAKDIFDAAKTGDALALKLTDRFAQILGMALANIAQVVNPEAFIIGGGVSKAGQSLADAVKAYADSFVMPVMKGTRVVLAELGNDAGIFGAAKFAQKVQE